MEENVVMTMEDEVLENQNEETQYDDDFYDETDIPDDIREAEERCKKQPIVALIVGGVAVGAAIGVGIGKLVRTVKRKKAERAEAKDAKEDIKEEPEESDEIDEHPEVPSEEAKDLLRPESQRKRTSRKPKNKVG